VEPGHIRFGGGATETLLHPLVAVWLLIAIVLTLVLPRKRAITPFLLAFFTIPIAQVLVVGGVHLTALRILILAGLVRMSISRGSSSGGVFAGRFNAVDRTVVLWTVSALTIISVQWMDSQALVKNLGDFLDALGGYVVVRFLIPDGEAIRRTVKVLAVVCAIQGVCMVNEQITHVNVFGLLGGFPLTVTVRDGHIRSQGVLGCIYAGVFAGVLIPLFVWLWAAGKSRVAACAGLAGATAIVVTSYSSTSWLAYAGSLMGLAFWPLRGRMRLLRRGFALTLVVLHLVMHGPVWSLIARMDLTGSSSGYHRYYLVDNLIRHFSDWWLLGYRNYNDWGWDMWDTCNQFVDVALKGGLVTLLCYIAIFSMSFRAIGTARKRVKGNRTQEWFLWCLGSALFANVVASFGINYMAQLLMSLFPLLACISVAAFEARHTAVRSEETPAKLQLASALGTAGTDLLQEAR
jgi:hypothetical protein